MNTPTLILNVEDSESGRHAKSRILSQAVSRSSNAAPGLRRLHSSHSGVRR